MTRIKIKTSERCYDLEEVQTQHVLRWPQSFDPHIPYFPDRMFPIVSEVSKRKRTPRSWRRNVKQKRHFLFSSDDPAGPIEDMIEDKGSGSHNDANEQVVDPRNYGREQDNGSDRIPAVIKTYTARRRTMEFANGINDVPQRQGNVPLKIPISKLKGDVLKEKQRGIQDASHSTKFVISARDQHVMSWPGNESTGMYVDRQKNKSNGSVVEGPVSLKQSLLNRDTSYQARETKKDATIQVRRTQAEGWDEQRVIMKQANDSLPGRFEVQRASAPAANGFESKNNIAKQFKAKHNMEADFDKNELVAALKVIKKIMKMEAAETFNSPVDPVALGIPDYFDVIDTPMDFSTICEALEKGWKYRKSQDVYEDVQLIWMNCRKYNNRGDPILELLTRVKKNFMKYWTAAGLYTDKATGESKTEFAKQPLEDTDIVQSSTMLMIETEQLKHLYIREESANGLEHKKRNQNDRLKQAKESADESLREVMSEAEDKDIKESKMQAEILFTNPMQKLGETLVRSGKHSNHEQHPHKKDSEIQNTPTKRRISGTGHHKTNCSCVVCTGVRRKLAREKGLMILKSGEKKPHILMMENGHAEQCSTVKPDSQLVGDSNKNLNTRVSKGESKGGNFEDAEDKEDVHSEEHFAEAVDAELERQEDEMSRYYHANHEIPLRKVNTSVLCMGQLLFPGRTGSPWSRAHSLRFRSTGDCSNNSFLKAIRLFVNNNKLS